MPAPCPRRLSRLLPGGEGESIIPILVIVFGGGKFARQTSSGPGQGSIPRCHRSRCGAVYECHTSNEVIKVPAHRFANSSVPATWVGVLTGMLCPSLAIVQETRPARGRHAFHRAEQIDERGQIIRSHVEQRTCAGLIKEIGIRMPSFRSVPHHKCRSRNGSTNRTVVQSICEWFAIRRPETYRARRRHAVPSFSHRCRMLAASLRRVAKGFSE